MWRQALATSILIFAVWSVSFVRQPAAQADPAAPAQQPAQKPESQAWVANGKVLGKRIKTVPGMLCQVCDKPIGKNDFTFIVRGQRIGVHKGRCYAALLRHPYHFLEVLQPHGAFLGAGTEGQEVSFAWFLVGLYVLTGLVFGALAAHQALHRGRSPVAWFGWGLALNVVGYLLLLARPAKRAEGIMCIPVGLRKVHATPEPSSCPECGKTNHPSAERCAGCGAALRPSSESEVHKAGF